MALTDKLLSHVAASNQGANEVNRPRRSDCFGGWNVKIRVGIFSILTFRQTASAGRVSLCGRVDSDALQVHMTVLIVEQVFKTAVAMSEERLSKEMVPQAHVLCAAVSTWNEVA